MTKNMSQDLFILLRVRCSFLFSGKVEVALGQACSP